MRTPSPARRLMAVGLCALLVACSATRPVRPTSEATRSLVLVIEEGPDGQVTSSWQPADSAARLPGMPQAVLIGPSGRVVTVASQPRDCDEENRECYRECMARPLPRGYGGLTSPRKSGGKSEYCRGVCQQSYNDCLELERLRPQEFTAMGGALDWLKRHQMTVLVGSIIVIAGVAFVVVSVGAGIIVLAPVVLTVSAQTPTSSSFVESIP